ncbi:MAG TPA: hypothetical protein VNI58_01170 [Mariprofundaceae bacterium]|nr:hypothetical protein [Mariprofundaceae bacterium]
MSKRKNSKKPRTYSVTFDMGEAVTANGMYFNSKTGEVALLHNGRKLTPQKVYVEQNYDRNKSPKVLNKAILHPLEIFANPNRALEQFDEIFAVDTNTKKIDSVMVSVTGIVHGRNTKVEIPNHTSITYRPLGCIEFHNVDGKPENLGWRETIKAIIRSPQYSERNRIAIIVDSDLGMIDAYNHRDKYLIEDFYLPENFYLIYASADSGSENIANKMIKLADNISSVILNRLTRSFISENLVAATGECYSHSRSWKPDQKQHP